MQSDSDNKKVPNFIFNEKITYRPLFLALRWSWNAKEESLNANFVIKCFRSTLQIIKIFPTNPYNQTRNWTFLKRANHRFRDFEKDFRQVNKKLENLELENLREFSCKCNNIFTELVKRHIAFLYDKKWMSKKFISFMCPFTFYSHSWTSVLP